MEIQESSDPNGPVLAISGDIDLYNAGELKAAIKNLSERDPRNLTLDFTGVKYIDSMGIGLIVNIHKNLAKEGRMLYLRGLLPSVVEVFRRTNLDQHLNLAS